MADDDDDDGEEEKQLIDLLCSAAGKNVGVDEVIS